MATQDPKIPAYDAKSGLLTDYGRSLGLKEVNSPKSNSQTGGNSSNFMQAIQDKLLGQSGIISSTNTQLETRLNNAISGVKSSADSANKALNLDYGRQIGYASEKGLRDLTSGREQGSGGIMNMAAYNALRDDTNKNLKDLEDRKQSLILQNDSAAASKIADLQFQALDFQQKAQQQTFSNLLGMANFGLNQQAAELAKENQTFQQSQAMSAIALRYGITVKAGDDLASLTTRAMPMASKEEAANLAKLISETRVNNANAAKVLKGDSSGLTDGSLPILANVWNKLGGSGKLASSPELQNILGGFKTQDERAKFYNAVAEDARQNVVAAVENTAPKTGSNFFKSSSSILSQILGGKSTKGNTAPAGFHYNFWGDLVRN